MDWKLEVLTSEQGAGHVIAQLLEDGVDFTKVVITPPTSEGKAVVMLPVDKNFPEMISEEALDHWLHPHNLPDL